MAGINAISAFFKNHAKLTRCLKWGAGIGAVGATYYFTNKAGNQRFDAAHNIWMNDSTALEKDKQQKATTISGLNVELEKVTTERDNKQAALNSAKEALYQDSVRNRVGDLLYMSNIPLDSLDAYVQATYDHGRDGWEGTYKLIKNDSLVTADSLYNEMYSKRFTLPRYDKNGNPITCTKTSDYDGCEYYMPVDSTGYRSRFVGGVIPKSVLKPNS